MSLDNMTSDDILKQIQDTASGLDEGGEVEEQYSFPEVIDDPVYDQLDDYGRQEVDRTLEEANLRERWKQEETARMQAEYGRTGVVPQSMNFEEWKVHREIVQPQENMRANLATDLEDIRLKFPKTAEIMMRKLRRGEVSIDDLDPAIPNALEIALINSISEQETRGLSPEQLKELIDGGNENPLYTRSLDYIEPRRKKPAPVKQRPKQQTYKMPELDEDDFRLMFTYLQKVKPEKFRGR